MVESNYYQMFCPTLYYMWQKPKSYSRIRREVPITDADLLEERMFVDIIESSMGLKFSPEFKHESIEPVKYVKIKTSQDISHFNFR